MKNKRIANDKYFTDPAITAQLTSRIKITGKVLDPCAGDRRMVRALSDQLKGKVSAVYGTDLTDNDELWAGTDPSPLDATTPEYWNRGDIVLRDVDWIITNPPFNRAPKILPRAYEHANKGMAMLLNPTYLEPCKNRGEWLKETSDQLRSVTILNPRPKFRADTDNTGKTTVAWFVWDKSFSWFELGLEPPFMFANDWKEN